MKNIILLGPQGAGKGTVAKNLAFRFDIAHISTGDLFRDHIKQKTSLGSLAESYISKGHLVPDSVTGDMVKERLAQKDCRKGYILDGFPRNLAQAKLLETFTVPTHVLLLSVGDAVSLQRLGGRRICSNCGAIYHVTNMPPQKSGVCDKCGGKLIQRDDDREEAIKKRLSIYHSETAPLADFYKKILHAINGEKEASVVIEQATLAVSK